MRQADGTVLLTGGHSTQKELEELDSDKPGPAVLESAEIYDPRTGKFSVTRGRMHFPREDHTARLLKTGEVLSSGGSGGFGEGTGKPPEIYDPKTGAFKIVPQGNKSSATGAAQRPARE